MGRAKVLIALAATLVAIGIAAVAASASSKAVTLTIESWRSDDAAIWNSKIIPAFEKSHPDINVKFEPTAPTEYNAALRAKLKGGTAGDLITCRPFDESLGLYNDGYLSSLTGLAGLGNFNSVAKSAWITDDNKNVFCVPMASVIHGFIYNKKAFADAKVRVPTTEAQFVAALRKIKARGNYTPLAIGTHDMWEAATMGFQNVGPNYWKGEAGRKALISGKQKFTAPPYVKTFASLAKWRPFLPKGVSSVGYADAQTLFTSGQAAIYPAGSWEISGFNQNADFKMGAFKPPLPAGAKKCFISDHTDIALGMNKASKNAAAAKEFLTWVASPEFGKLYSNALPGFFSLQKANIAQSDPLAKTFVSWRKSCSSTIRNSYQILSRGTPNMETELWAVSAGVLNGKMTPKAAAARIQKGLARWYEPQQ